MIESEIQSKIIEYLKTAGFLIYRMNSGSVRHNVKLASPGTPDLMVISPYAATYWLEVKTETGKLSIVQENMHARLRSYGQKVFTVRSVEDVREMII